MRNEKDDCQLCCGEQGGVKGNENIIDGVVICDYCTVPILLFLSLSGRKDITVQY
jgi:hypothetical protein